MAPQRSNLVLSTDIPYVELCVFVSNCFDVEANRWDCSNILLEFEVVENSYRT
jgi:hypothetical protein